MKKTTARLAGLFFVAVIAMFGQAQGTIQGVVSDNTGAVIPGASIAISNIETGVERTTESNEVGFYSVPALNSGPYIVIATSEGFAPTELTNLRLEVG